MEDAQYPDAHRLDSVKHQVAAVTRNRPEADADFVLAVWRFQSHSLLWCLAKPKALLDNGSPPTPVAGSPR